MRRTWYRRKLVLIPLMLLVLLGAAIGGALVYINARFDTINSLSTPPAVITGSQLGGDEGLIVDTGPAQDAVRRAQQGEPTATTTAAPDPSAGQQGINAVNSTSDGYTLMAFGMQREVTPVPDAGTATPTTIQMPPADPGQSINVLLMGVDGRRCPAQEPEGPTSRIISHIDAAYPDASSRTEDVTLLLLPGHQ